MTEIPWSGHEGPATMSAVYAQLAAWEQLARTLEEELDRAEGPVVEALAEALVAEEQATRVQHAPPKKSATAKKKAKRR